MSNWHPILEGDQAAQASAIIQEVGEALRKRRLSGDTAPSSDPAAADLAGGAAGNALLFGYLAEAGVFPGAAELALELVDEAIDAVADAEMDASLYSGFTGVAWVIEHLSGMSEPSDEDDMNEAIDEALVEHLDSSPWLSDYDLISGLVGFGVYLLERLPKPSAVVGLTKLIDRLDETALAVDAGIAWFTPPELMGYEGRTRYPDGHFNLGVAHGVPGVIPILAAACAWNVAEAKARSLLDESISWLLSQRQPSDSPSCFGYASGPTFVDDEVARAAWCYGDPGIAGVLLNAARLVGYADLEREANAIGLRAAVRPREASGVEDAAFCHGAAGLAHIFNRLHQSTGNDRFADSSRYWYDVVLQMHRPGEGVGGFLAKSPLGLEADAGFLTGAAGIALCLLGATTDLDPGWDRSLLLTLPSPS